MKKKNKTIFPPRTSGRRCREGGGEREENAKRRPIIPYGTLSTDARRARAVTERFCACTFVFINETFNLQVVFLSAGRGPSTPPDSRRLYVHGTTRSTGELRIAPLVSTSLGHYYYYYYDVLARLRTYVCIAFARYFSIHSADRRRKPVPFASAFLVSDSATRP